MARTSIKYIAAQSVFLYVSNNGFVLCHDIHKPIQSDRQAGRQRNAVGDHFVTNHLDLERKRIAGLSSC